MRLRIELTEEDLKRLVAQEIEARTGNAPNLRDIRIEVKSKQNYRSEWERAAFRAILETDK